MPFAVTREFADSFLLPLAAGNPSALLALCTPATRVYWGTTGPLLVPEFLEQVSGPMTVMFELTSRTLEYTSIVISGSRVIVEATKKATMVNGEEYRNKAATFYEIDEDGKIAEWRDYSDTDYHKNAFDSVEKWRAEQK